MNRIEEVYGTALLHVPAHAAERTGSMEKLVIAERKQPSW